MSEHRPVRRASSSLIALCRAGSACPHGRCGVFAFLVEGIAFGSVSFPVFAKGARYAHGFAEPQIGRLLAGCVVDGGGVADWELEEFGGTWSAGTVHSIAVLAVCTCEISQVLGRFVDAGQGAGTLGGGSGAQSCLVVGVVSCFAPDSLDRASLKSGISAETSTHANPIRAVTRISHAIQLAIIAGSA